MKYGYNLKERLGKDFNRDFSVQNCLNKNNYIKIIKKDNEDNKQGEIFRTLQTERSEESKAFCNKELTLPKLVV